eukprot:1159611-Pelagomonas_calceolata.AAC.2
MELSALEDANNLEYEKFVRDWERRRAELNSNISEQHNFAQRFTNCFEGVHSGCAVCKTNSRLRKLHDEGFNTATVAPQLPRRVRNEGCTTHNCFLAVKQIVQ